MSVARRVGDLVFGTRERLRKMKGKIMESKTAPAGALYSFEAKLNDGKVKKLADCRGQVLLIVNTASECGYTPQYEGLEALYQRYKPRGFKVLGFPCNQFGKQEPGGDAEIKEFCRLRYGVGFELFSKVEVKGEKAHPLYRFLTGESGHNGAIPWNFTKFVVARDGRVADRFGPDIEPLSKKLMAVVEGLLSEGER